MGGIAKNSFSHVLGLYRFWCYFDMVFDGFGTNFDDFWWLGGRLETSWFSMLFRGVPDGRAPCRMMVFGIVPGPHCHPPNSFQQQFNMQNTSWNMQEWRDTKKQDANYENTKNQSCNMSSLQRKIKAVTCSHNNRGTRRNIEPNPSQPGGPSSRGRRIVCI